MSSARENVDRLSTLPEEVLSHIHSLMPMKVAVRTSILSKRWRYSWTLATNLDFTDIRSIHGLDCYYQFVDRALKHRKASQVKLFRLRLEFYQSWYSLSQLSKWISEAVRLNICELDLCVTAIDFPFSLFTCKTLSTLRVSVGVGYKSYDYKFPSSIDLPCLKTLEVSSLSFPCLNAFKLIHACPIIESLTLNVILDNDSEEYTFNIPTLKILKLHTRKGEAVINKIVLNVPNLESLSVGGTLCSLFVMENLPQLVEVTTLFTHVCDHHLWFKLVKGISEAKSVTLFNPLCVPSKLPLPILPLPKFSNTKHLKLYSFICTRQPLLSAHILESASELEHLCIEELEKPCTFELGSSSCWIEPQSVPNCILKKLRTVEFINDRWRDCHLQFLKYILGKAEVLKTLTITTPRTWLKPEMILCANLLKFPRASRHCEILIVGKHFNFT